MRAGIWFWIIYVICLLFGIWFSWPTGQAVGLVHFAPLGGSLIVFILIGLLGWKVFGPPVQG